MKRFSTYLHTNFLEEKVISIGYNSSHDKFREEYRKQIFDMLQKAYSHPSVGGYSGLSSGSKQEADAINNDISNYNIKAVRRGSTITAVNLYKDVSGRKLIAAATDGTPAGKIDWRKLISDDHEQKRAWAEVSGAVEAVFTKTGMPMIPNERAKHLTGKSDIRPVANDKYRYVRKIGDADHEKIIMGHTKPA